jgi:succinate--hydroxymethylglutarate CoA-transferase
MLLGDLGAEVIKIEGPNEGDPIRTQGPPFFHDSGVTFYATNRNKYSCAINMRTPEGKLLAQQLASKADIIVENFRPEVMTQLGLDYESLSKKILNSFMHLFLVTVLMALKVKKAHLI